MACGVALGTDETDCEGLAGELVLPPVAGLAPQPSNDRANSPGSVDTRSALRFIPISPASPRWFVAGPAPSQHSSGSG